MLSDWPIHVHAADGRATLDISGGCDWLPVRVSGLDTLTGRTTTVSQGDSKAAVGADSPGAPWYNAWPDDQGGYGVTFLVRQETDVTSPRQDKRKGSIRLKRT